MSVNQVIENEGQNNSQNFQKEIGSDMPPFKVSVAKPPPLFLTVSAAEVALQAGFLVVSQLVTLTFCICPGDHCHRHRVRTLKRGEGGGLVLEHTI